MSADADEVNSRVLEIWDAFAETLRGVHVEKRFVLAESVGDFVQRLDDAGLIVHVHHGNEKGVRSQRGGDLAGRNRAAGIGLQEGDGKSEFAEKFERFQNRLVFDGGGDDVAASGFLGVSAQAEDCEVVALGGSAGEDDVLALGFDHGGNLVARALHRLLGAVAVFMRAAAGVPEFLAHINEKFPLNLRVNRGGGVAIQIDGGRHGLYVNKKLFVKVLTYTANVSLF